MIWDQRKKLQQEATRAAEHKSRCDEDLQKTSMKEESLAEELHRLGVGGSQIVSSEENLHYHHQRGDAEEEACASSYMIKNRHRQHHPYASFRKVMARPLRIGAAILHFEVTTTNGDFGLHGWLNCDAGKPWFVLFSHPTDFTPGGTTERGESQALNE